MRTLIVAFVCAAAILPQIAAAQNSPQAPVPAANQEADLELRKAINAAGNDSAALVRNLHDYLRRFPETSQKVNVYRALIESCQQIRDDACTLDAAEQLIAIVPDDSSALMTAVDLLEKKSDAASLNEARTFVTRVIDHTESMGSSQRPERLSLAEWQDQHAVFLMGLYLVRGDIDKMLRRYDDASHDYQSSYAARANPSAAEGLADVDEMHSDLSGAIQQYLLAFVLPDVGPRIVDRREVRVKLGNVWQQVHGTQKGLGEEILAAYDRTAPADSGSASKERNADAKNVYDFVLRRLDNSPFPLAPLKGKTLVLSFWATWCAPCRELEPQLAQIAKRHAGQPDVVFLAVNADEDESLVPDYLAREKWDLNVVFSDGLARFFGIDALPTVFVLDRDGKVVYKAAGYPEHGFAESIENAVRLGQGTPSH